MSGPCKEKAFDRLGGTDAARLCRNADNARPEHRQRNCPGRQQLCWMANNAAPQRPTLVLDNGSRFTAVMLALPGMEASRWPKAEFPAERPVEQALDFLKKK